ILGIECFIGILEKTVEPCKFTQFRRGNSDRVLALPRRNCSLLCSSFVEMQQCTMEVGRSPLHAP
ncbi:hypothetical protein PENTCL1PPCAC_2530, partial [Pristionchus entomophagus]